MKALAAKGINATVVESMDPVDARIGAPDLCKDNNATGVIVGSEWHKQDYKQGAVKSGAKGLESVLTIVPIAGPIMAGMVNAGANAASSVGASDDKYPAKAEVDLTLLSCEGKRIWSGQGLGETAHQSSHNAQTGESGAIDLAVGSAVEGLVSVKH